MMLKHICSLVAFFMMPLCVGAQNAKHFKYQGEVNTSYSFCIDEELNNLNLEVINGVRFSRYLYAGVGLGATANFSDEAILFPVFIDLKGYMPVTSKMDLIAGVDVGTKLDYTYDMSGGLLFRPEFGLNFPMKRRVGLKLTLLYELYSYKTTILDTEVKYKTNEIGLKFGVSF